MSVMKIIRGFKEVAFKRYMEGEASDSEVELESAKRDMQIGLEIEKEFKDFINK